MATEVFVMTADPVLDRLEALAQDADDDGLDDLGDQLLPHLVDDGSARSWALDGYWRDVGTVQAYWQAHQEFLAQTPPLRLGPDARVGGGSEGEVALVGRAVELSAGTVVPPGGRLPEED